MNQWKIHKWYDNLPDPNRFFYFMVLVTPGITLANFSGNKYVIAGCILFLGFIGMHRWYWLVVESKRHGH